ncbi:oxysterol-binding protein-related protein 1 isoform X2 [Patella vulgata]|uniref:oxysterol-binding protein-related protein 1 isoform X2 n=1 Tax=Patella vulgata TaxID=6465 RepID=UPI0024A9F4C2|nr:oxysterol-binding protein-related protein 1 isoform X2 [Patella vulgata]
MMSASDEEYEHQFTSLEEEFLHAARNGNLDTVEVILAQTSVGADFDINCRGTNKANRGWTALHLAAYFGHIDIVRFLLERGADVNVANSLGDTPLHRAAYTGRLELVTLLLQYKADVLALNSEGHLPKQLAKHTDVKNLIEAAEHHESKKIQELFLASATQGDVDTVRELLKSPTAPPINCQDQFGNTALHLSALRGRSEVAVLLLQNGINTSIKNKKGQLASDMTKTNQMKQLLDVQPIKSLKRIPQRCEGQIFKKSKLFGYRMFYAVLEKGVLSYFQNRGDAVSGSKRKGMKYLDEARLQENIGVREFRICFSDGTVHNLNTEAGNGSQVSKQKWLTALKEHIAFSTHYTHQGEVLSEVEEELMPLGTMLEALQNAQAAQKVLETHVSKLHRSIEVVESTNKSTDDVKSIKTQLNPILESSREMCDSLSHCMTVFVQQEELQKLQLKEEKERCRVLQEALRALAMEHHELERSITSRRSSFRKYDTDDDEFYDCDSEDDKFGSLSFDNQFESFTDAWSTNSGESKKQKDKNGGGTDNKYRTQLPVPMFSSRDFSLWSILKQCIGKELSKITMPVVFNEPLSFLQRLTEYMEYSYLLDRASQTSDPIERLQYVSAFAVSAISSNWERLGKPFNPLLGETYELDRQELGFRLISEQVSHHPPISAFHIESPLYKFHGQIYPKLKFWGKSVDINPKGFVTLELTKFNEVYTWQNVNCCVHNIIVGKLWVEHYGTMEIINHRTKHRAVLNFKQGGWFGKELHKVEGYIYDPDKIKLKAIWGNWLMGLFSVNANVYDAHVATLAKNASPTHQTKMNGAGNGEPEDVSDDIPCKDFNSFDLNIPNQVTLWQATPRPEDSSKYYSFTMFAMTLNELTEDLKAILPPTDSRLRPDIRFLEEGNIDAAADEKNRLEEKQRQAKKDRKKKKGDWSPEQPIWTHKTNEEEQKRHSQ